MKAYIHRFDYAFTGYIRRLPRSWDPFFLVITRLGDPVTVCLIALAIGVWAITKHSIRLAIAATSIPATLIFGYGLKLLFERARPLIDLGYNLRLDSFSFPSGHSSGSMIAYGLLSYIAWSSLPAPWNLVIAVILAAVPFMVGISRIYLGVHYPSDVVAGWLLGLIVLTFVVLVIRPFS